MGQNNFQFSIIYKLVKTVHKWSHHFVWLWVQKKVKQVGGSVNFLIASFMDGPLVVILVSFKHPQSVLINNDAQLLSDAVTSS